MEDTQGIILHSDLGSQYTSQAFESYLSGKGMIHSFSRKGNPYDNACIESFHSVLKKEEELKKWHNFLTFFVQRIDIDPVSYWIYQQTGGLSTMDAKLIEELRQNYFLIEDDDLDGDEF